MKVKIPKWEAVVICSTLLFPDASLSAQEVGQEEGEVKEIRQDVEQPQQDIRQLREEVRKSQEEIRGFRHNNFPQCEADTVAPYTPHHFIHQLGIKAQSQYVFPTNPFLQGENERQRPIQSLLAVHLKYSFKFRPNTYADRIYDGACQGFGLAFTVFDDKKQLGDPMAFYIFQGARITRFNPRLSLNYEWNFDVSAGWKPYDNDYDSYNGAVDSQVNAYLNAGICLDWSFSRYFDFIVGGDFTHFSNGNTKFPNTDVNTTGAKIGLVYNFNQEGADLTKSLVHPHVPRFPRHASYDLVLFGPWRRKGAYVGERQIASSGSYPVVGFNFAPICSLNYKLRFGASLDGIYDGSTNVYTGDALMKYDAGGGSSRRKFLVSGIQNQLALGLSRRAEYVMPFLTIGVSLGTNMLGRGDLRGLYQVFALKVNITRNSFLHVGYNLQDFQTPNYLMLGLGFRPNNKYPKVHH